jgi:Saxitoxin biosynthesis operon protein SxtJ
LEAGIPARLTAFLVLGGLLYFWRHLATPGAVAGGLGALLALAALAVPSHLGPLQRAWMGLAHLISRVTTPIFMGIVFFLVMMPIGLLRRLAGKNALAHPERDGGYWAPPASGGRSDLNRQF